MSGFEIHVESLNSEIRDAYIRSGMDRGGGSSGTLDWTFGDQDAAFATARTGGQISGISAYIRTRMKFGDQPGIGCQAVDSFVFENLRGQGVFTSLAKSYDAFARNNGNDLIWGFPNDSAAPAWFGKLGWHRLGQAPFLVLPLRASFFLRKLRLPFDFRLYRGVDQNISPLVSIEGLGDELWEQYSRNFGCATVRDSEYLSHRLLKAPRSKYRVVADVASNGASLVATREAQKHGGRIGYLMEAMGEGSSLRGLLVSELARLRDRGTELVLAWSFPWSPNYKLLRKVGFMPLPESLRPIRIWFGAKALSPRAISSTDQRQWYLSYLDSDTV